MQVQFVHAPVHTPEQVRAIIAEATVIADKETRDVPSADAVFAQACTLLGARASLALPPQTVDLTGLNFPFKATG